MVGVAAGFAAWLGVSLVVLSDGRRGLAVGMAMATAGLAALSLPDAGVVGVGALLAGGAIATLRRLMVGPPGWAIMPAGSTPRLVTCVAGGLLALWVGVAVTSGDGAALRFAVMAAIGLAGARVLWSDDRSVLVTAVSVLAIAIAVASALALDMAGAAWPYAAAAVIAAGAALLPSGTPRAA